MKEVEINAKDISRLVFLFKNIGTVKTKIILFLYLNPYRRLTAIANTLCYHKPTISSSLSGLLKMGVVKRESGQYSLTKVGKIIAEAMIEITAEVKKGEGDKV